MMKNGRALLWTRVLLLTRTKKPCRSYDKEKGGGYNDLSYYEGRYPSQIKEEEGASSRGTLRTAELNERNPLRQSARRAPGLQSDMRSQKYLDDQIMQPR